MKILINYANLNHFASQRRNSISGEDIARFDRVIEYGINDIDKEFKERNHNILSRLKGAGYWLWKPYIILKTLQEAELDDFVFYSDAGAEFIAPIDPLIELCRNDERGIILFHSDPVKENKECHSCKRDVFVIIDADKDKYTQTIPLLASFQLYKVSQYSISFVKAYLGYCEDERLLLDTPNISGLNNYNGFKFHRHDQSILSVLSKKWDIKSYRDPSQFGNPYIKPEDGYGQIINHTRSWD